MAGQARGRGGGKPGRLCPPRRRQQGRGGGGPEYRRWAGGGEAPEGYPQSGGWAVHSRARAGGKPVEKRPRPGEKAVQCGWRNAPGAGESRGAFGGPVAIYAVSAAACQTRGSIGAQAVGSRALRPPAGPGGQGPGPGADRTGGPRGRRVPAYHWPRAGRRDRLTARRSRGTGCPASSDSSDAGSGRPAVHALRKPRFWDRLLMDACARHGPELWSVR